MNNIIINYIIDEKSLECHLEIDKGEKGEKDSYGMLLSPNIMPSADLHEVYYKGVDVTFLLDEKTIYEIEEFAIENKG
jgi:hypothetical protein